jgi:hypothetical protein
MMMTIHYIALDRSYLIVIWLQRAKVVQPRLQALNCYVTVDAEATPLSQLSDEFFSSFSVILVTDCSEVGMVM